MTGVRAAVDVSERLLADAHDEAAQRPIAVADRKRTGARIAQFIQATDGNTFLRGHYVVPPVDSLLRCVAAEPIDASINPARVINQNNTMPGSAITNVNK